MEQPPTCQVSWDPRNGIARNTWAPGAGCRLEDAKAVVHATAGLGRGAVPVLVDMRHVVRIERSARRYFNGPDAHATAIALLVGSAVSAIIGRVMTGLLTSTPCRTFTDETAALAWLTTYASISPPITSP